MELSNAFVVCLGIGTVFFGLICIIFLTMLMSWVCRLFVKTDKAPANNSASTPANQEIPDRQKLIAAVSAVVAEELGTDVSAIRILSIKKL